MEPKLKKPIKYWEMSKTQDNVGEIAIYGEIVSDKWYDEEVSATSFKDDLDDLGDVKTINLLWKNDTCYVIEKDNKMSMFMLTV